MSQSKKNDQAPWLIVSAGFHFQGGQAKAVAALADFLARRGNAVHLVGHDFDGRLVQSDRIATYSVRRPMGKDAAGVYTLSRAGHIIAKRLTRTNPATRVVVNGGNCSWSDINWVHYLHAAYRPKLQSAPAWFRVKEQVVGALFRRRERRAIRSARIVITNSKSTATNVVQFTGVPPDRVRTVYYGADSSWIPPNSDERQRSRELFKLHPTRPIVAFVGGFSHDNRKGFDTLLAAWRQLCQDKNWDADLVMAGSGNAAAAVNRQIANENLTDRVRLVGFTDRVFEFLSAVDLLVSPVRYEPYGLNVQEAICRGIPAIVSRAAGVAEEYPIELQEMLLSEPDDCQELINRLRSWRGEMPSWKSRFKVFATRLRMRSWDDMAHEIVTLAESP